MDLVLLNLQELSLQAEESSLWNMFINCLQEKDSLKQLTHLRKIAQYLKKYQWNDSLDKDQEQLVVILADMYKAVEPRSANSRTIASILQSFPENLQEVIIKVMKEQVQRDVASFKLSEDAASMRRKLDFVSAHMENFPIGQTVIRDCVSEVLPFCHQCLGQIIDLTRNSVSVVKKTEFMNHCLACLKIVMSLAQKYSERLIKDIGDKVLSEVLEGVTDHSLQVLNDEMFSLDCRSAAGLAVALIAKLRLGEDDSLKQLLCLLGYNAGQKDKAVTMTTVTPSLLPLSCLFLLHGILAMHSPSALLQKMIVDGTEKVILTDVAFWELMNLSDMLTEASWSLCAARTIVQWGIVAKNSASCCEELKPSLRGSGVIANQLMGYIWKSWDHPVDGIRHQCRSIFENLIETHIICQQGYSSEDPFMSSIFQTLMTSSWHVRCKYRLLVSMVPYFNVEKILVLHPTIARDLMMAMTEQSIAPYASELLEKLFKQHFQEIKDSSDVWCTVWIKPSLTILLSDSLQKQQERYLSQYFIPKVLKCNPPCLSFVVNSMDSCVTMVTNGSRRLNILIMWLKVARSVGVLKHGNQVTENESIQHLWKGIVTMTTLQEALSHRDNQIILDALGLLCDSKKTTEELSKDELELLQQCLPLHLTNQSAAFRQQLVAMMKKMLYRLKDSSKSFEKSVKKSQKRGDVDGEALLKGKLNVYKSFLENLWHLLMEGLSPGYSYPQRTTSLLIITTVRSIFKDDKCAILDYKALWDSRNSGLLLQRLTDTFDLNKVMTFDLLKEITQEFLGWEDPDELHKMYKCALRLAASSKPHHCETAAYLLRLLAQQNSPPLKQCLEKHGIVKAVLEDLSSDLEMQISRGRSSLLEAAVSGPMYGILHCVRALLSDIVPREVINESGWLDLFQKILSLALEVADVASPTVCNSSPEGYIPETSDSTEQRSKCQQKTDSKAPSHLEVFHVTPQMVLVCCWRSMKEVSLTLGHLALVLPMEGEDTQLHVLSFKKVEDMGKFFLKLLMESKHRGAFELAYAGFEKLCVRLWRSSNSALACLPRQWLHDLLSAVTMGTGLLCATRRSAGVPFAIQAIVGTEPDVLGKNNLKETMRSLIKLVADESNSETAEKVHAFNILRALYRDTRLGEEVFQFVAEGVVAAVGGFGSKQWAVRNSSTLLFSALVTRIFGVNREKDELSKKNCMTGREFFSRFPSLHAFLIKQLQSSLESSEESSLLHPSLFPTLIILSHLHPSYQEVETASLSTKEMIPLVISCSQCAVYKTRCMAARALSSLVSLNDVNSMLVSLIQSLPSTPQDCVNQNQLHGILLMVKNLIEAHVKKAGTISAIINQFFKDVLPLLKSYSWISSCQNRCATTRAAFMQIISTVLIDQQWILSLSVTDGIGHSVTVLTNNFVDIFIRVCLKSSCDLQPDSVALAKEESIFLTRFMQLPEEHVTNICDSLHTIQIKVDPQFDGLKISRSCLLMKLLCSPLYEVRLIGLNFILDEGTSLQPLTSEDREECKPANGLCKAQETGDSSTREEILVKLVAMVTGSELNVACLGKALQVLADRFPIQEVTRHLSTNCNMSRLAFFKNMLELANCHFISDDICSPIISITGKLLLESGAEGTWDMLAEWTEFVESSYAEESSTELSISVSAALSDVMLATCKSKDKVPVDLNIRLWNLLLHLLLRDELLVQQLAVRGLQEVAKQTGLITKGQDEYNPMMHCYPVIELAVHLFIAVFLEVDTQACLAQLCRWACGDVQSKSPGNDENKMESTKLFERGEASSGSDDILMASAALVGLESIAAACKSCDQSGDESGAYSARLTESTESTSHLIRLRINIASNITGVKQIAVQLFQDVCSKVETSLQDQPLFTMENALLNVDQFEVSCLHFNRFLKCIKSLASLCEFPKLQYDTEEARKIKESLKRIEGKIVTKVY